jgi:hypothetical protein
LLERTKLNRVLDVSSVSDALTILRHPDHRHAVCAIAS